MTDQAPSQQCVWAITRGKSLALANDANVIVQFGTNCDRPTALHIATDWLRRGGDRLRPDEGPE